MNTGFLVCSFKLDPAFLIAPITHFLLPPPFIPPVARAPNADHAAEAWYDFSEAALRL